MIAGMILIDGMRINGMATTATMMRAPIRRSRRYPYYFIRIY